MQRLIDETTTKCPEGIKFNLMQKLYSDEQIDNFDKQEQKERRIHQVENIVPLRYRECRFDNYEALTHLQQNAVANCKRFIEDVQKGKFRTLTILGKVGTGKTHLACATLFELGGIYKSVLSILEEIRHSHNYGAKETELSIIKLYGGCTFLVIDEIGRGFYPNEEKYLLYQILNERYNNKLPTMLISNMTESVFFEHLGEAVCDRLTESNIFYDFSNLESYRYKLKDR